MKKKACGEQIRTHQIIASQLATNLCKEDNEKVGSQRRMRVLVSRHNINDCMCVVSKVT